MYYLIVQRYNPLNRSEAPKFYPAPKWVEEYNLRKLSDLIARHCTLTPADVTAVLEALLSELPDLLMSGHIVRLGDFGILKLSFKGEGRGTAEDVTAKEIKNPHILFLPGVEFKQRLQKTDYKKFE